MCVSKGGGRGAELFLIINVFHIGPYGFPSRSNWTRGVLASRGGCVSVFLRNRIVNTHYHNSNLIWRTVSRQVDEVIPSDHPRRVASRVIQWYGLIHET